jgi:hypothetical protein
MDTLAHAAFGVVLFSRSGYAGLLLENNNGNDEKHFDWTIPAAAFFGAAPDLLSFSYVLIRNIFNGSYGKPPLDTIPNWVFTAYNLTHSLIVVGAIVLFLFLINKKYGIAALAWPFHILCDIPTHTKNYFPTPFLYPLSDFTVNGISFMRPYILIPYGGVLIILTAMLVFIRAQQNSKADISNNFP